MSFKSGFIALVGRPNVGKSTLLNQIFKSKLAIVSDTAQTTRKAIRGVLTTEDYQLVFIDTPGIHRPQDELGRNLNREAYSQLEGIDLIYFVIDANDYFGPLDQSILDRLFQEEAPIFLIVNKIDKTNKIKLIEKLAEYSNLGKFDAIIPVSALEDDNIEELLNTSLKYIEEGPAYFDQDQLVQVDTDPHYMVAELIREKVLRHTSQEIPHEVAVVVETLNHHEDHVEVSALIIVSKDSHKPILIGKQGAMIKKIRQRSQREISKYFNKPCQLELFVRVERDWRVKQNKLKDFGYIDD